MLLALDPDGQRVPAHPRQRDTGCVCPLCKGAVVAHCGPIVRWHWAHTATDCDSWTEPETSWHLSWKARFVRDWQATIEVSVERAGKAHRADVITPRGVVVELQSGYLSAMEILARELFWPSQDRRLMWIYRADPFMERIHFGERGFWWKQGSKAMATHRWPVWWHVEDELWRVSLNQKPTNAGQRILGRVLRRLPVVDWFPSYGETE